MICPGLEKLIWQNCGVARIAGVQGNGFGFHGGVLIGLRLLSALPTQKLPV